MMVGKESKPKNGMKLVVKPSFPERFSKSKKEKEEKEILKIFHKIEELIAVRENQKKSIGEIQSQLNPSTVDKRGAYRKLQSQESKKRKNNAHEKAKIRKEKKKNLHEKLK